MRMRSIVGLAVVASLTVSCSGDGANEANKAATSAPGSVAVPAASDAPPIGSEPAATEAPANTTPASDAPSATEAPLAAAPAGAVPVVFDTPGDTPRPIKETVAPIDKATDRLAMSITKLTYRGVVCGFSFKGEAPPSPVTIRLRGATPLGDFDSGPLDVTWTALDADTVSSDAGQDGTWNFSSEAHADRETRGWVVSVGGVTAPSGSESDSVPTQANCELVGPSPVFGPANGPVGYWAGFAAV